MATTTNLLFCLLFVTSLDFTVGQVGVCFGRLGNNLPGERRTIALYKKYNITRMRLYDPHPPTLQALAGSNIRLMMGVPHENLQDLANCPQVAIAWVQRYILPYPNVTFKDISVGNEVDPASSLAPFVLPAMQNIYRAIRAAGLGGKISVSTSIRTDLLNTSYPPQAGEFKCSVNWYIRPILEFLRDTDASLLVNVYPYFAYINDRKNINLSFALLQPNSGVIAGGVYYDNLYYAILDAVDAAIDRILAASLSIFSEEKTGGKKGTKAKGSETGWPTSGGGNNAVEVGYTTGLNDGPVNTVENARIFNNLVEVGYTTGLNDEPVNTVEYARIFNNNLMRIVKNGTPRNPGRRLETYIFAMYDENLKPGPAYERHFGIFLPDGNGQPKYPLRFY